MHPIRVFINGYTGKMGEETVKAVLKEPSLTLVGKSRRGDDFIAMLKGAQPHVVVDFTHPSCVKQNTLTILENGAFALIGTTGLSEADLVELNTLAKEKNLGVLVCPNFAIGAILMMQFAAQAAKHMPRVEIIEFHHDKKADAPSGTALKTADLIYENNALINELPLQEKELIQGARGGAKNRIPIHSVRLPGYVAHQEVIFGGLGQTLTLRHDTISRESFMPGVVLAIQKIQSLRGVVYGLENVL